MFDGLHKTRGPSFSRIVSKRQDTRSTTWGDISFIEADKAKAQMKKI